MVGALALNELLIAGLSFIHIAVHLKWKKIEYKILYFESAIILTIGLVSGIYFASTNLLYEDDVFRPISGLWYLPTQPVDLIFIGLSLFLSTVLLDFLTKFYDLDRGSLLAILPWTITCQYRFLHELIWVFHYWITMNEINTKFMDKFIGLGGIEWIPALLTHMNALLFIVFSIFNFAVMFYNRR